MTIKQPCLAYVHIEKAAGSTLHDIFSKNIFGYHIFRPYEFDKEVDNQLIYLSPQELIRIMSFYPFMSAFGGHSIRSYAGYEDVVGEVLFITFLRDPIKRFYSHYLYQKEIMSVNWNLDEFIASGQFNNFMCNKIAGKRSFDSAVKELKNRFFFVGLTEDFDSSLMELKNLLSIKGIFIDVNYEKKNVRSARGGPELNLEKSTVEKIIQANLEDIRLYEYVKNTKGIVSNVSSVGFTNKINDESFNNDGNSLLFNRLARHCYVKWLEKIFRSQRKAKLS